MVTWQPAFSPQALEDARKVQAAGLKPKVEQLFALPETGPFQDPSPFEPPVGDVAGASARRIDIRPRRVGEVSSKERVVRILRMWTHYE